MKKTVLKRSAMFAGKLHTCNSLKETPTQVFSSEYCKVFKNTCFEEHLLTVASDFLKQIQNTNYLLLSSDLGSDNSLTGYEQLSY